MTSYNLPDDIDLPALFRAMVKSAVQQAEVKIGTTKQVSGTVEDLNDEELDVVWVRADSEMMSDDPTQSMNFEWPGVMPTVRLGETFVGDQVRTIFDDAGASSLRTSALKQIVIPFGAEAGERIRIFEEDGKGYIAFFDENEQLVMLFDPVGIELGDLTTPGRRVSLDPQGGIRMRSEADHLVAIFDQNSLTFRDEDSGLATAEISGGSLRIVDPVGTDSIEMETQSTGTLSNPSYKSAVEANPGASLTAPAAPLFTTTPADDIEIAHVAAWIRATNQAATMTEPGGHIERADENFNHAQGTLQTSVATRDPATGLTGDFTSSLSNWQHAVGTRVVVRGGGPVSPAFRSISYAESATAGATTTVSIAKPAGTVANDILVVFVSMGVNGGGVPTGWVTPPGFMLLGATFSSSGSGATQTTVATGAWVKLATASEPSDYSTSINLPAGTKLIAAHMVAISDPWLTPGGVQIRMAGKPIRRLLAFTELPAASATLCDFQGISQAYDNLELVFDGLTDLNGGSGNLRIRMRYNNDAGATNYAYQLTEFDGTSPSVNTTASASVGTTRILLGGLSDTDGAVTSGRINIHGYATPGSRKVSMGQGFWVGTSGIVLRNGTYVGQYNPGSAINRITIAADGTPNRFKAGSRAYLYGY